MSVEIKRNRFFKKQTIGTGVNVNPLFSDLPLGTATTAKLGSNYDENVFVLSTQVPDAPNYGDSTLNSAALSLFCTEVDFKKNANIPQIIGYRLNNDINIKEGGYTLATGGDRIAIYSVKPNNTTPYLSEEFEGDVNGIGGIVRMGGNAISTMSEPYIFHSDVVRMIENEDGAPVNELTWNVMNNQFAHWDSDSGDGQRIKITPDSLPSSFKFKKGETNKLLHTKYYKYFDHVWSGDYLKHIKYNKKTMAASNLEGNPDASKGNTIFNDFFATRNFSNPFDTTTDDPMVNSVIELSTEKTLNGGQALRMYHNWGYSINNPSIQKQVGVSGNMNAQCARVSLYDIPMPNFGHDIAKTSVESGSTTTQVLGQVRAVIPEIRLPMNLTTMGPNVEVAVKNYASGGVGADVETPWTNPQFFYGSTTTALNTGAKASMSSYEQTFLRSVVVTFSNYKPLAEHTTVDEFLTYGLTNFYQGRATENIVGGFVLSRFAIDGSFEADAGTAYAFPLPVTRMSSLSAGVANSFYYTQGTGGMALLKGLPNTSVDDSPNVENSKILSWGRTQINTPEKDPRMRFASIPMNAWFTARIFTDIFQKNNSGSTAKRPYSTYVTSDATLTTGNASEAGATNRGVAMRVIFENESENGQLVTMSGTTIISTSGNVVDSSTRNLPFLDIPFPVGDNSLSSAAYKTDSYTFADNPDLYPKHMTIWVQNYPWVSGGNTTDYSWNSLTTGSDNMVTPEGSSREVELFIDSVNLYNYTPDIQNLTANNDSGVLTYDTQTFSSPSQTAMDIDGTPSYYGWFVGSAPINYTVDCFVSGSGDTTPRIVKIKYPTQFDTGYLENAAAHVAGDIVTIAGTGLGGTSIDSIDSLDTFTMNNDPLGVGATTISVTFTSTGTINPPVNKADMTSYDAGQCVVFGMDDKTNLPLEGNTAGYFLWSDFNTSNWSGSSGDPLIPDKTSTIQGGADFGAIYSQATGATGHYDFMGGALYGQQSASAASNSNINAAKFDVASAGALTSNAINIGSGAANPWLSYDAGRQKGFMYLSVSGTTNTDWIKRENILTSVRVTECEASSKSDAFHSDDLNNNQIKVNDISVFNYKNESETYIIYLSGEPFADTSSKKSGLTLDTTLPPINNIISFKEDLTMSDGGTVPLMLEDNLYRLLVSPEKFSLSMLYGTPATRVPRSFDSLCLINETPATGAAGLLAVSGTTFNETTYTYTSPSTSTGGEAGLYKRPWSLAVIGMNDNVITDKDYGYGSLDEDTGEGGEMFRGPVFLEEYNYYNIPDVISLQEKETLNVAIYYNSATMAEQNVTINTDDYAGVAPANPSQTPIIYWEYLDMPPVLSALTVTPAFDLLNKDTKLYELNDSNLNAVRFNWKENNAGDIWYRYLITDTGSIDDKYHNATSWTPLNEAPPQNNLATAPVTTQYSPWNGVSSTGNVTVGTDVRSVVEGQGGYAIQLFNTAQGKIKLLGDATTYKTLYDNGTEWTLVMHWTPSAADKDTLSHIASEGSSLTGDAAGFNMHKNTSNLMVVQIGAISMTGSRYIVCDGSRPTSIIVTLDTAKPTTAKLYVDGILDATSITSSSVTTGRYYFVIGGLYSVSARGTTGFMEEVIIYNRALEIIESSNEYVYNTTYTLDGTNVGSGNDPLVNNARLFAADYHNFRGTSEKELGMTQSTSWRTTLI